RSADGGGPRRRPWPAHDDAATVVSAPRRRPNLGHAGPARVGVVGGRRRRGHGVRGGRRPGRRLPLPRLYAPNGAGLRRASGTGEWIAGGGAVGQLPEVAGRARAPGSADGRPGGGGAEAAGPGGVPGSAPGPEAEGSGVTLR